MRINLYSNRRYRMQGTRYILSEYVEQAMAQALYDKFEDSTFSGRIPVCKGVVAFGATLRQCEDELRSTLEFIDFVWGESIEESFNKGFEETLRYKNQHGTANAPSNYKTPDGFNLGHWQTTQRL